MLNDLITQQPGMALLVLVPIYITLLWFALKHPRPGAPWSWKEAWSGLFQPVTVKMFTGVEEENGKTVVSGQGRALVGFLFACGIGSFFAAKLLTDTARENLLLKGAFFCFGAAIIYAIQSFKTSR